MPQEHFRRLLSDKTSPFQVLAEKAVATPVEHSAVPDHSRLTKR